MAKPKPESEDHPRALDGKRIQWYHYAFRRLPLSLLISFLTLIFVIPFLWLLIVSVVKVWGNG